MSREMNMAMIAPASLALSLALGCSAEEGTPKGPAPASTPTASASAGSQELIEKGRALYKANCVMCHGETGKGDGPAAAVLKPPPRDHSDRAYMSTLTDEDIAKIIRMGGASKGRPLMPSHPQFSDEQLKALVAYIRSLSAPARPAP